MKYVMMRFYAGGGLADSEIINCEEDSLVDNMARFEKDCASDNLGEYCAVLDEDEFKKMMKDFKSFKECEHDGEQKNNVCLDCGAYI